MSTIDVNEQWRELQENYAGMSEDELQSVAQDAYDLTDMAKQALGAEISRRNLKIDLQAAPVPEESAAPEPETEAGPETEPETESEEQPQETAEEETSYTPHCPRCHSTEIVFQSLDLDPLTKSAFDSKYNWSCDACGYHWKDDGIEKET